jgi:potassium efflux system protein
MSAGSRPASASAAWAALAGGLGWLRLTRFLTAGFVAAVFGAIAWRVIYKAAVAVLPFLVRAPLAHVREGSRQKEPVLRNVAALLIGLAAALVLMVTPMVARVVRFVLSEEIAPRVGMAPGIAYSVSTLSGYFVWVIGLAGAANAAGFSGTQMTVLFGALGVGLGFGLQAIVNNFVSGLILVFERPVSVGDRVEVGTYTGIVERIGIRASVLRTYAGAEIVIPNADLITKEVTNWTLSDARRRVDVPVGVAYGTDLQVAHRALAKAVEGVDEVHDHPSPEVLLVGFGESSIDFVVRYWHAPTIAAFWKARSDVTFAVEEALATEGITIPFPQRTLWLAGDGADDEA